ncbi:MAG TPA: acyl-CoA dehydrogenase family protein [Pyrinomonadaceae bacterium]|nr:acyl-CoA dehydrogenase family protein [Pyrinomonadaceae bacterium]
MPDFNLTDEQSAVQRLAHEFARNEIMPVAEHHDRTAKFPWQVVKKAYEVGLMNPNIPTEYGGPGLTLFEEMLINEELAWGCAGISGSLTINNVASLPILIAGNEQQKRTYLGRLSHEQQLAAYAVSEPNAGTDVAAIQTKAERVGDEYILNGTKQFITNASVADFFVVFAVTDKSAKGKGISAFIVERDWAGVIPGRKDDKMGQRASNTAQLIFEDVRVPKENLLGQEGDAFKIAMKVFDRSRPGTGVLAVGVARRALEEAVKYAGERKTFGVPIGQHQAIQFKIADMATQIQAARWLCWHAAWLVDQGHRSSREASMAKCFGAQTAVNVTSEAVQIFGGYGYVKDYVVEKLYRDAKVYQIYEGTSEIQRLIIGRSFLQNHAS